MRIRKGLNLKEAAIASNCNGSTLNQVFSIFFDIKQRSVYKLDADTIDWERFFDFMGKD